MKVHLYIINRADTILDENLVVHYSKKFREYGIPCDENSYIIINNCPWCGEKLPVSLRDKWFDELKALGYKEFLFNDKIPDEYKSDEWWKKKGEC
jgi:hypothetical protein